mgnify:CR=1 FL=1
MKTVIATTTLYAKEKVTDQIRFILACQMLEAEKRHNYPTVVLDGSSPKMHEELKKINGDLVYPLTVPGMGPGRRLVFFYALHHLHITLGQEDGVIFWTEPEKPALVKSIKRLVAPIIAGQADVVIPKRLKANFATYPSWQAEIEHAYNSVYEAETGRISFDPAFGPVAFRASALQKLLFWNPASAGLNDTYITHYLPILVRNDRVASVEVDCPYPPEQKASEEENKEVFYAKRIWQRDTYIKAYRTLAKLPKLI